MAVHPNVSHETMIFALFFAADQTQISPGHLAGHLKPWGLGVFGQTPACIWLPGFAPASPFYAPPPTPPPDLILPSAQL